MATTAQRPAPPQPESRKPGDDDGQIEIPIFRKPKNGVNAHHPLPTKFQNDSLKTKKVLASVAHADHLARLDKMARAGGAFVDPKQLEKIRDKDGANAAGPARQARNEPYPTSPLDRPASPSRPSSSRFDSERLRQFSASAARASDPEYIENQDEETYPANYEGAEEEQGGGNRLAQAGIDKLKQEAGQRIRAAAGKAVKQAGAKVAKQLAAKALLTNPWVLGAIGIVVAVVGVIILVVALAMGTSGADAASTGTSETVSFERSVSSIDLSRLKAILSGGITTKEKAETVLAETARVRPQLATNTAALTLLDDIDAAANAIIAAEPDDMVTIKAQEVIIKKKITDLDNLLSSSGVAGSCKGISPCLDAEGIAQQARSHCGIASITMALLYVNKGATDTNFKESDWVMIKDGKRTNKISSYSCVSDTRLNHESPPDRKGWIRVGWRPDSRIKLAPGGTPEAKKQAIIEMMIRSLHGNDPVVIFLEPGGAFRNRQHIMLVVGYDESDEGGTFLVNNPVPGNVTTQTKNTSAGKLTARHIMRYMGGTSAYFSTALIRGIYFE